LHRPLVGKSPRPRTYRVKARRRFLAFTKKKKPSYRAIRKAKKQAAVDEGIRNRVEGKFGQAKRRFGLGRIMAKLASTSAAQISLSFLVMNLEQSLRWFFFSIVFWCHALARVVFAKRGVCPQPF